MTSKKGPSFSLFHFLLNGPIAPMVPAFVGLTLSLLVVLSALGIMSGFEKTLIQGLMVDKPLVVMEKRKRLGENDVLMAQNILRDFSFTDIQASFVQQGYLLFGEGNAGQGVLVVELAKEGRDEGLEIGRVLAENLGVRVGDEVTLLTVNADTQDSETFTPHLQRLKILKMRDDVIHEQGKRLVRFFRHHLTSVNQVHAHGHKRQNELTLTEWRDLLGKFWSELPYGWRATPFWSQFATLLEAVDVEKKMIIIVLQFMIVMALFSAFASSYYVVEKKRRDIFILRALGLSLKKVRMLLFCFMLVLYSFSFAVAWLFIPLMNFALRLPLFQLSGDIYQLTTLRVLLDARDGAFIFILGLVWFLVLVFISLRRWSSKHVIHEIRKSYGH
jgi:ABC-type lipoprotein release transport system permease subunit